VRLNADLYRQFVNVYDLEARLETEGLHKGKSLIEGAVRNNGYRTVSSVRLMVEFLDSSDNAIHAEYILPLRTSILPRTKTIATLSLFTSGKEVPLLPGESARFKHALSEQKDKDVISPIKNRRYGTNPNEWSGRFRHKITGIKF
jgi:hypothetical protein